MAEPVPRRMTRPQRRAALLDAAAKLINEQGIGAFSFEAMADEAGVAKTLPYAYFESKDEVLLTLFERVVGGCDEKVVEIASTRPDLASIIRESLGVWFDATRTEGRLLEGLLEGRAVPGLAAAVRARDRASHKLWHDLVVDHLGLVDVDAHVLAAMLNDSAPGILRLWLSKRGSQLELVEATVAAALGAAEMLRSRSARGTSASARPSGSTRRARPAD